MEMMEEEEEEETRGEPLLTPAPDPPHRGRDATGHTTPESGGGTRGHTGIGG